MPEIPSPRRLPAARRTAGAAAAVVAALAVTLSACGGTDGGLPEDGPDTEQAVALEVDPVRVTVQETGAADAAELRFDDVDAPAQQLTAEVGQGFDQQVADSGAATSPAEPVAGEGLETVSLPLTAATTPAAESDAGERRVQFRVGETADVPGAAGFTAGWTADSRGRISAVRLAAPVGADDTARARAEQAVMQLAGLPVVFPEQPVGTGAVWTVDSRVTGQATLLQTTTFTLRSRDGDRVHLDVAVQQRPAQGALDLSALPGLSDAAADDGQRPGRLDVLSSNTASRGSLTLDLTRPLPVAGEVLATTRVVYGGDGPVRVHQDTSSGVRFTGGQPGQDGDGGTDDGGTGDGGAGK